MTRRNRKIRPVTRIATAAASLAICVFASNATAKDLYVAVNGSDSVSYSANSINTPWRTILHAVYNIRAGDTLYIRGGTYRPTHSMVVRSEYENQKSGNPNEPMNAESGTASQPVRITSYPGERVIIDCANVGPWLNLDGKDYWEISDLEFINSAAVVLLSLDSSATNNKIRGNVIQMNRGGDNTAAIKINTEGAEYTVIEGNIITGPGVADSIHGNTSVIYLRKVKNVKIVGNILSGAPIGIYYKHATLPGTQADTDIEIAYNYITNTRRNALQLNLNRAHIHNNIFGPGNAGIIFAEANGVPGGDYNLVEHNTFFQTGVTLPADTQGSDPTPGSYGNIFRDNIFWSQVGIHPWASIPHATQLDSNIHSSSVAVAEHRVNYSLSEWQSRTGDSMNSMTGSVTFVGGSSPNSISGFALANGSLGKGAGSDGQDIGANVDLVGAGAPVQPMPPGGLN